MVAVNNKALHENANVQNNLLIQHKIATKFNGYYIKKKKIHQYSSVEKLK